MWHEICLIHVSNAVARKYIKWRIRRYTKMNTRKLTAVAGLGLGLSLAVGAAQAALWSFEDDDIDFILDPTTLTEKTSGTLNVGDIFVSTLEIPIFNIDMVNAIPADKELTGVAAVQLAAIVNPDGTPVVGVPGIGSQYIFAPFSGGMNAILALGFDPDPTVAQGGAGQGATLALWFNGIDGAGGDRDLDLNRTSNPATNCLSLADCIDQASLGDIFQVDGFSTDPDNFWVATQILAGGNDISQILGAANDTLVSAFNFGLTNFFNPQPVEFIDLTSGLACGNPGLIADGCAQVKGSGTITGGQGLINGAIGHSDFDGQKITAVPEPSILGLLGVGLLLGFGARLKRKA